ncbi:restriction endonuclease subunit S [Desmonostoc muscorum CCALA 125]|nr:restriction endonuclease subunit S [Desmonostoc muscorum CCALA 125]
MDIINIPEGYKQTEMGVIPKDWDFKQIGEIAVVSSGGTPSRTNPSYWNGNIPWITTTQIDFNTIISSNEFITELGLKNSAAKLYTKNTLLMAMYGQGKTRGKVAILGIEATINQACAAIIINKDICNNYVFFYLAHNYEEIRKLSNTGNQENLNGNIIKSIFVSIPPLPEQKAIAQSLSDIDALITECDRIIAKKRNTKQGTMQQLLTGKKRLPGFSGEWEFKKLGEMAEVKGGKRLPKGKFLSKTQTPYPYIKVSDMFYGGVSLENIEYVPEEVFPSIKNYRIYKDDLFISVAGTLGIVGKIPDSLDGANLTENADRLTSLKCNKEFLFYVLISPSIQNNIDVVKTTGAQPKLALIRIKDFQIFLPSPSEQKAIAQILSDMDAEIEAIEQKRDKYKAIKQGMMQELLTGKTRLKYDLNN